MCKLLSIYSYSTIFFQVTIFDSVNEYILLFTFLTIAVILVIIAYCITIFHWTTLVPNLTFCSLCASGIIQRLSCVVRFKASVYKLGLRGFIRGTTPPFQSPFTKARALATYTSMDPFAPQTRDSVLESQSRQTWVVKSANARKWKKRNGQKYVYPTM